MGYLGVVPVLLLVVGQCVAQNYRVCAEPSKQTACPGVQLGTSRVVCTNVETNIDCAIKIQAGEADFGVFSEEEVLLLAQQQPDQHHVLASVRHQDKLADTYAFETVAVVRATHTNGLAGLSQGGFCHPGYNVREHRWSPRVLKYFEDVVAQTNQNCDPEAKTPAGSQAAALSKFFSSACRPGAWTQDRDEDAYLKTKYPSLCDLCNGRNCSQGYSSSESMATVANNQQLALNCLARGNGNVTYTAWQHVRTYFQSNSEVTNQHALLCEDGTLRPLTTEVLLSSVAPCSWVRQHWPAVLASRSVSTGLLADLRTWLPNTGRVAATETGWTSSLDTILFTDPAVRLSFSNATLQTPTEYVTPGRGSVTALSSTAGCHKEQRWCTLSVAEQNKCNWVRRAALSLGVQPQVECSTIGNEIDCLNSIQMDRADFISLDSNYGYIARKHFKLSSVLYHQTQRANASRVVALLKTITTDSTTGSNDTVTRFENLRGKTACFPEYGGLAWVTFVRAAHERGVISETECNYAGAASQFLGSACAPGAELTTHAISDRNVMIGQGTVPTTLCSACRANPNYAATTTTTTTTTPAPGTDTSAVAPPALAQLSCQADYSNLYFGTNGTLACIAAAHTDVAFIETQYLSSIFTAQNLNPNNFRALCRNNSLAQYTGINVDEGCLLAYTVDGELLARRDWSQSIALKSLFLTLDDLFGSAVTNQLINLKIFSPFNGMRDLLFKDSVIGFAEANSTIDQAKNYEELFRHLDACSAAGTTTVAPPPASAARVIVPLLSLAFVSLFARLMV